MKYLQIAALMAMLIGPAAAQTSAAQTAVPAAPVTQSDLQALQTQVGAQIWRERVEIAGLTAQMRGLDTQLRAMQSLLRDDNRRIGLLTSRLSGKSQDGESQERSGARTRR
jgi:hypothetical protein